MNFQPPSIFAPIDCEKRYILSAKRENLKRFKCVNQACCWSGDADFNGSKNIAAIGVAFVNQPRSSNYLCCNPSTGSSGLVRYI
ncbi:hypothetical protein CDG77_08940 [Nostoc sp. 'Peltigera membranacea cyanobiont' 213]|uniref:hypothetical protein n=1 Tax=Nostoc sp. 'Peltigera membranacea cyanobiont' 213 TaxID=2014530 RepID=UPI000B958036|nr:hypothetical protein [Nostoc sp. 'Peltigera membranacea cyanobiont' 213]OYD96108.1 hypothetical protein CDG77_08940 [Nostoc sp. 'Peltigera membranacea cyanobiont' 213]